MPIETSRPVAAGVVTALVGFTSAFVVVLQGLTAVGATHAQPAGRDDPHGPELGRPLPDDPTADHRGVVHARSRAARLHRGGRRGLAAWSHWWNTERLHTNIQVSTPLEHESAHYAALIEEQKTGMGAA